MPDLTVPLGPALRAARESRRQTMEETAAHLHVSLRTLWRWEHGAVPNRLGQESILRWLQTHPERPWLAASTPAGVH